MQKILQKILEFSKTAQPCALATVVESTAKGTPQKAGAKMMVFQNGTIEGTIGGGGNEKKAIQESLAAIKSGTPRLIELNFSKKEKYLCGGTLKVFIEPILPQNKLILCGAGHVGLALSFLGKFLQFNVTIIDTRKKFIDKKKFAHVDHIINPSSVGTLKNLNINQNTYIVIATHDHETDFQFLNHFIKTNNAYLGVIASRSKRNQFIAQLQAKKISQKIINKIHMPIGLDIGAQTPNEIALSVMAEIISITKKEFVGTKKFNLKKKGIIK
ncbi:MAG: XdhC/CoxI family protein [Candidatus Omnitrophica bacterium]|nr:XdhC/CoxI family protein [Candidatus Omnitrophota bacterium]